MQAGGHDGHGGHLGGLHAHGAAAHPTRVPAIRVRTLTQPGLYYSTLPSMLTLACLDPPVVLASPSAALPPSPRLPCPMQDEAGGAGELPGHDPGGARGRGRTAALRRTRRRHGTPLMTGGFCGLSVQKETKPTLL